MGEGREMPFWFGWVALLGGWDPRTCKWLGEPPIYKPHLIRPAIRAGYFLGETWPWGGPP